jgi:3-oxoacyl-[acyl-carrier-protein] synthase-1
MSSPRPDAKGAQLAIQAALDTANMAAVDLAWVNLHGTGTVQNDAMEALAINTVLGEAVSCASTKALTGHTLGAAGALEAAFLWAVMSEQYNPQFCLPPHRADFALDEGLAKVHLTQSGETYLPTQKRCALSTSFAFGGNNTALIIGNKHANPDY